MKSSQDETKNEMTTPMPAISGSPWKGMVLPYANVQFGGIKQEEAMERFPATRETGEV